MKQKKLLTALGLLLVALAGISFFLPRNLHVSVTRVLQATPEQVFAQVNRVENWPNWAPWFSLDPDMTVAYGEIREGEGASYTWKSEKRSVGIGAMTIDESIPNQKVGTVLMFESESDSYADLLLEPAGEGRTAVTWNFESDYEARLPWDRYRMAFFYVALKGAYGKGLSNLEAYIAQHPEAHLEAGDAEINIAETEVEAFEALTVTRTGRISDMEAIGNDLYAGAYGEVMKAIAAGNLEVTGHPLSMGVRWDEAADSFTLKIGLPVASGGEAFGATKALRADYFGPYNGVETAYDALWAHMQQNGWKAAGAPWEVYVTDPAAEPDTGKWLTEVYWPVNRETGLAE